jgi:antitoxin component YwqK of YwqJK toxin-antitoxin module
MSAAKRKTGKKPVPYRLKHRDGSLWAKGQTIDGVATGFWQWFRKDGSRMRSGYFHNGAQIGEWTTYDKAGRVHKMTEIKGNKPGVSSARRRRGPPTGSSRAHKKK